MEVASRTLHGTRRGWLAVLPLWGGAVLLEAPSGSLHGLRHVLHDAGGQLRWSAAVLLLRWWGAAVLLPRGRPRVGCRRHFERRRVVLLSGDAVLLLLQWRGAVAASVPASALWVCRLLPE